MKISQVVIDIFGHAVLELGSKLTVIVLSVFIFIPYAYSQQDNTGESNDVITINSTVTGNQEQPNEIYIVPWKSAVDRTILYQTLNTRLENVFGHIERREHIRQLDLIQSLSKPEKAE